MSIILAGFSVEQRFCTIPSVSIILAGFSVEHRFCITPSVSIILAGFSVEHRFCIIPSLSIILAGFSVEQRFCITPSASINHRAVENGGNLLCFRKLVRRASFMLIHSKCIMCMEAVNKLHFTSRICISD